MSRADDWSNDGLVVHKQSGGLTCTLSRLLNILTVGGHIGSKCAVDWLQCEPDLIYTYLYLQHEAAMLCLTACHTERQWTGYKLSGKI